MRAFFTGGINILFRIPSGAYDPYATGEFRVPIDFWAGKKLWALVKSNGPVKKSTEETQFLKEIFKILIIMYENNFKKMSNISTGTIFSKSVSAVIESPLFVVLSIC